MYDMYPWDRPARPAAAAAPGKPATEAHRATEAVQVALDRRDNGGAAAGAASEPTAGPTRQ